MRPGMVLIKVHLMTFAFNLPRVWFPFSIPHTCCNCCVGTSEYQSRRTTESSSSPHNGWTSAIHDQCLGIIKDQISAFNCNENGVSYVNIERIKS